MKTKEVSVRKENNIARRTWLLEGVVPVLVMIVDYLMILTAEFLAYHLREQLTASVGMHFQLDNVSFYATIPLIFLFFLHTNSESLLGRPFWRTVRRSFWSIVYGMAALTGFMYLGHMGNQISRLFLGFFGIFVFITITVGKLLVKKILQKVDSLQMPVIFVGAGMTAEKIMEGFDEGIGFGFRVIGFIDDAPVSKVIPQKYRILGGFDDADKIIRLLGVKHVIIAAPGISQERQVAIVNRIQPYVKSVSFIPDLMGTPGNLEIISMADAGMMMIRVKNNLAHRYNRIFKRIFDLVCAGLGTIALLPVFAIIAALIYKDDPGPIFFAHRRVGKGGREFPCYKFRSMCVNAQEALEKYLAENPAAREEWNRDFKLKDDPRITKIGNFLRKSSLDELPQLINVIKGEMSLVGPRPIVTDEIEKYGDYINDFYLVPPGITGVWQVSGRSDTTYDERVAMDSWYVHNWSIWMDINYLIKTVSVVLYRKGAY